MRVSYDPVKNARNIALRGLTFERAAEFGFDAAFTWKDERQDYREDRWVSIGFLGDRLHVLCYLVIPPDEIRVISLRKANDRERRIHARAQTID